MGREGDWRPTASLEALRFRARVLRTIREFLHGRGILEVETPLVSRAGTVDLWIDSFEVRSGLLRDPLWLATSPEFHMKRLLCAGSGPIWQMGKAFRDEGCGRLHNPEFTILEWYRPGWGLRELCGEVEDLVRAVVPSLPPARWTSFRDAFLERVGVDPFLDPVDRIRQAAEEAGGVLPALSGDDRDGWIDLLLSTRVEPGLGDPDPVFLWGYPPSRAALARLGEDRGAPAALRAEFYWKGVELTNAYDELSDPVEQSRRFRAESDARAAMGKPTPAVDHMLLDALRSGLPEGSGVALGVDRLVALAFGASSLSEVVAFAGDSA